MFQTRVHLRLQVIDAASSVQLQWMDYPFTNSEGEHPHHLASMASAIAIDEMVTQIKTWAMHPAHPVKLTIQLLLGDHLGDSKNGQGVSSGT